MNLISQYRQDTQAQAARLLAGSRMVDTACGQVEFGEVGAGPAVLISHGSLGGYDQGLWLAGLLGAGIRCLAPSRFGYLRTPLPRDASPTVQADQYAALLDVLEVESAVVIGLSAGGPAALQFALTHPERCKGLVMLSALSHRMADIPLFFKALFFGLMKANYFSWLFFRLSPASVYQTNGVSRSLLAKISQDSEKIERLRALAATSMLPALRRAGMQNDWQQITRLPDYPLARIAAPTLVVHAVNDPVVALEFGRYSAEHIPGARLLVVPDGGHFCCLTHKEIVIPEIMDFIKRLPVLANLSS